LTFDKEVITVDCYSQTFGAPGVKEHALFLKDSSRADEGMQFINRAFGRDISFRLRSAETKQLYAISGPGI